MLTKPLGTGVTTTALKAGQADPRHVERAVDWMTRLNAAASALAVAHGVRGATDITGFSLLGHGLEMANASRAGLRLFLGSIPFLDGARTYCASGHYPGGSEDNFAHYAPDVSFEGDIGEVSRRLLFDAQTSGGLLLSIRPAEVDRFDAAARAEGVLAWPIGEVIEGSGISVRAGQFRPTRAASTAPSAPGIVLG
jgi:selenide,water dikinase